MNKKRLEELALDFIGKYYGGQEQEDPCYNIQKMVDYMVENYDKEDTSNYVYIRHCDECGKEMWEGFCIENGMEYYCSEECLYKNIPKEEYEELYDEGNGDSYWTDWYDELRIYNKIKGDEK